jgi:dihydrofolate reductase
MAVQGESVPAKQRKIIVHIATSVDGFIAGPGGDLEWLTSRPAPEGFYGMVAFEKTIDTKVLGRKTYDISLGLGAKFDPRNPTVVFSRRSPPRDVPSGVEFVNEPIADFVSRLRQQPGKHIWLMGGGELIAAFLDAGAVDEFVVSVVPVLIGEGIPLLAPHRRHVSLELHSVKRFDDGLVQLHYHIPNQSAVRQAARSERER